MLLIVGDSHAQACFQGFPGAHIEAINGRTAWRVANNGIDDVPFAPQPDDTVVWLFGEVDCRCHLVRLSGGASPMLVDRACGLALRYCRRIAEYPGRHIICSVLPPSDLANSPAYPIAGSLKERALATALFNKFVAVYCFCGTSPVTTFCDFHAAYALPDGSLNHALSDGNVHVATEHNQACRDALEAVLKIQR